MVAVLGGWLITSVMLAQGGLRPAAGGAVLGRPLHAQQTKQGN
jgi:hypothetical protein